MIHKFLLVLALIAALNLTAPVPCLAEEPDVAGLYKCEGVNPDGSRYRGTVEITKNGAKNGRTYRLRWGGTSPGGSPLGIGIINGDVLAVSYFTGAMMGVVLYRIEKGPRLTGEWTVIGADGQVYPETLTKMGMEARNPSEPATGFPNR